MRPLDIVRRREGQDIHLHRTYDDRDLIGFRIELRQHVPRVVAQPLRLFVLGVRGERDRPTDLDDHLGYGLSQPRNLFVELVEIFRAVTRLRIPDMKMQHRRAGVVTIHRPLSLFFPGDRDIIGVISAARSGQRGPR